VLTDVNARCAQSRPSVKGSSRWSNAPRLWCVPCCRRALVPCRIATRVGVRRRPIRVPVVVAHIVAGTVAAGEVVVGLQAKIAAVRRAVHCQRKST